MFSLKRSPLVSFWRTKPVLLSVPRPTSLRLSLIPVTILRRARRLSGVVRHDAPRGNDKQSGEEIQTFEEGVGRVEHAVSLMLVCVWNFI